MKPSFCVCSLNNMGPRCFSVAVFSFFRSLHSLVRCPHASPACEMLRSTPLVAFILEIQGFGKIYNQKSEKWKNKLVINIKSRWRWVWPPYFVQ